MIFLPNLSIVFHKLLKWATQFAWASFITMSKSLVDDMFTSILVSYGKS